MGGGVVAVPFAGEGMTDNRCPRLGQGMFVV